MKPFFLQNAARLRKKYAKMTLSLALLTGSDGESVSFCGEYIVRACSMFYPYEGYRSVTPLDAARVNRTIFHNHSVH